MLAGFRWNALFYCRGLPGKAPSLVPKCVVNSWQYGKNESECWWAEGRNEQCSWTHSGCFTAVSAGKSPLTSTWPPTQLKDSSDFRAQGYQLPRTGTGIAASLCPWDQGMKQTSDLLHALSRIRWFWASLKQSSSTSWAIGKARVPCEVSAQLTASKFKLRLFQEIFTVSPGNVIFKHFKLLIKTTTHITQLLFFMLNTHVSLNTQTAVLGFNIRRQDLGCMCKYHTCSHISEPWRLLSSEFAALMLPNTRQDTTLPPSTHKPLHKCQQQDLE